MNKDIYFELRQNEEEYKKLENDILELQEKLSKTEKTYRTLQEETKNNMDIFSPRSNKQVNKERLEYVSADLDTKNRTLKEKNEDLLTCKQRMDMLNQMLQKTEGDSEQEQASDHVMVSALETSSAEGEAVYLEPNHDRKKKDEKSDTEFLKKDFLGVQNKTATAQSKKNLEMDKQSEQKKCTDPYEELLESKQENEENDKIIERSKTEEKGKTKVIESIEKTVEEEDLESSLYDDVQKERFLAGNKILDRIKEQKEISGYTELADDNEINSKHDNKIGMEIQSGEVIILESERKKEREFLTQLFLKIERSLALLNGNRNLCKKEMQQAKKMIEDYVNSISN